MSENILQDLLNEAAKSVSKKNQPKPQPLNGSYRNQAWYRHILKGKNVDEAYAIVVTNLKTKSFAHEADCAMAVWQEIFGVPFQSREERKIDALAVENAELRRKLAELEAAKTPVTDSTGSAIQPEDWPKDMDKEKFKEFYTEWYTKSQGVAPTPLVWGKAWAKYQRDNDIEAQ